MPNNLFEEKYNKKMLLENISAISTAIGVGGVAIIRISGESPLEIAEKMFFPSGKTKVKDFEPYKMYVGEIDGGNFRDFGMCVYFRAPKSYTGENMVEFHCHGGMAITRGILQRTFALGAKPATRGEFTKRAFLNGKLSLSSCEGLIDMINSESEGEVKAGYYLYKERLMREIRGLQQKLQDALTLIDANIDFPEEGLEEADASNILQTVSGVNAELKRLLATYSVGRKVKNGVKVAIVGKPNTGKSSILNRLLCYDKAIVSPVAGTTRDVVEGTIINDGVRFELFDTAGIRESKDAIEAEGINRSRKALEGADVALLVIDGSKELSEEDRELIKLSANKNRITVLNKSDEGVLPSVEKEVSPDAVVSALTGENVEKIPAMLSEKVFGGSVDLSGDIISEERHFYAIKAASESLKQAEEAISAMPLDAVSVDITEAWQRLGEITGETASESIINDIFSRFCVGK